MKILYIYNRYQQSGGENKWAESEADLVRSRGHNVVVYKRDNKEIESYPAWKKGSLLWKAAWSDQSYREVKELIQRERPDVSHVHNTLALVTPSVYYACHDESVPIVQTVHNYRHLCPAATFLRNGSICEECMDRSLWQGIRHKCYRNSSIQTAAVAWTIYLHRLKGTWQNMVNVYLAPTEFMRGKLIEGGLPRAKIFVKPNFHEPDPGLRRENDGSVIFLGRLIQEKGIHTLLAAWRKLKRRPLLRIIGDGPLRASVEAEMRNGDGHSIEFLGFQTHAKVIEYVKRAAFLVLPSEWYEGFPHVILEAYACGVPVVASRIGSLSDLVLDGKTGLLHEPRNPCDLAIKVERMSGCPDEAVAMGLAGRAEYKSKYSGECTYQQLMTIYSRLQHESCAARN